ncbi:TetR/AcrR family transcriptional regulator [Pulveribacter suum]|uniref:TetR family transcriptional regulator n=1 Tax=Pulveribacter suum TaxID=2116657 RepID=A0A2P1NQ20_9BURK|nr:TetR/AcrR family transcriptional regulator [Pulveribacter suum]AVP59145.1 TetR family transcriptional regulator [Pulveribacter suum]
MKVSREQAARNRQDIVDAAARLYRAHGLDGVGVAEVTRGAGLTHGGLYRHFGSKDALVREACARAFELPKAALQNASPDGAPPQTRQAFVQAYLSPGHRDQPGEGCPVAALAADVARASGEVAAAFTQGVQANIARFAALACGLAPGQAPSAAQRADAIATLSTLVGALVVARATAGADPALSQEILETVRAHLGTQRPTSRGAAKKGAASA